MLALKLTLVPAFLLLISIVARRWGPSTGGWLAGLPLVGGPILFVIAIEQGADFVARASTAGLLAVPAIVCFGMAYAHAAQRLAWPLSLCVALLAWAVVTLCLSMLPVSVSLALLGALVTLIVAPRLFPAAPVHGVLHTVTNAELGCRMLAGALVTVTVSWAAGTVGEIWSGMLAVFPTLATVLAPFSHRAHGGAYVAALLRAITTGMYSFASFCLALAIALPHFEVAAAFTVAIAASLVAQLVSKSFLPRAANAPLAAVSTKDL